MEVYIYMVWTSITKTASVICNSILTAEVASARTSYKVGVDLGICHFSLSYVVQLKKGAHAL